MSGSKTFDHYVITERAAIAAGRAPVALFDGDHGPITFSQSLGLCSMSCVWCQAQVQVALEIHEGNRAQH